MYDNRNTVERAMGLKELQSIHDGLDFLAKFSLRLNDNEMAQKLKAGIELAEAWIERLKSAGRQPLHRP